MSKITMLQHYIIEALKRAEVTEVAPGRVCATAPEFPHIVAEGDNRREAEEHLAEALWGWVVYQRALGHRVPNMANVDLNTEEAAHLLEVEHGIIPGSFMTETEQTTSVEHIVLTGADSVAFAETIIDPREPNANLTRLFRKPSQLAG